MPLGERSVGQSGAGLLLDVRSPRRERATGSAAPPFNKEKPQ
jgi:hypothetical protein